MKKTAQRKAITKRPTDRKYINFRYSRLVVIVTSVLIIVGASTLVIKPSSPENTCANSITCVKDLSAEVENGASGVFDGQKVTPPKIDLLTESTQPKVLGAELPAGPKHIYVDLTTQTLSAFQGDKLVMKTFVSTGRWHKTPTGDFNIWIKLRSTRMAGGSGADYYNLPNVPYVMFFYNDQVPKGSGFSLHGAYWHNNFGYTMSHGCVNMRIVDSEALYNWADPVTSGTQTYATTENPGTPVTIYGEPLI